MPEEMTTIDAAAFPLTAVLGPHLMLMVPVDRFAVPGLDEAYTEAALDFTAGIQSTGTSIDARWKVAPDHRHVLLILNGRLPQSFQLAVRFTSTAPEERAFFTGIAEFADTGPVSLHIYPDKADVVRAAKAVQDQDTSLFVSLGIGVEPQIPCRTLLRLNRPPRHRT
ncbi:hypothetical protein [Streptomyces sp. NPDC056304]|uniref:hypothetical protein n=1 Tax=Streptomyces sp. NPDC056304 TaxID=3345778 RepID=UPI0035D9C66E